ncbi:uncharacterized protein VICG_01518 [Vittaforma corneae ATCC 50505]|uniref:Non-structural maintenance of chromosome element 4 C-terminal domain-containing protein n=1 Tax=Vittaforma corneae (strain ATCC 50505) TaxID=993615 RepID=L2GKK2_VITCO|nr:uncharacterized protein VICG_01518 [Vittaforma corneae ATCC 50505]ELA41413.1 hypothetical protein VICG_01518 [Vittaforma corneae ATCC 50505]
MENISNKNIMIPSTYFEIFEFINENKQCILDDWTILFEILKKLDELLKSASCMSDLHKDTSIILETIKLQQDILLKEVRNELTLERLIQMAESEFLDDFFIFVKSNSQAMVFIDRLIFNYTAQPSIVRRERTIYDQAKGFTLMPKTLDQIDDVAETNAILQDIRNEVLKKDKVEFFNLIIDLNSYSKTVINAFNLALAIRMKLISLKMVDDVLFAMPYNSTSEEELGHSILEITPAQYEKVKSRLLL